MGTSFSSFFSSSSGIGSQNYLADYASIKNGSYAKVMKAYYGKQSSSTSSTSSKSSSGYNILDKILEEKKNPTVSKEVQEANSKLTTSLSSLKSSVSALQKEKTYQDSDNGTSAEDNVVSAMKDFVSNYNDVVTNAKKSTLSSQTSHVANMMRMTTENADKLKEMGITINANGTLQLSEGRLKETDISKVQELFSANNSMSYGSRIMSRVQFANASASASASSATSAKDDKKTDSTSNTGASTVKENIEALLSDKLYEKTKDKDGKLTYDVDKILGTAKSFVNSYNSMLDAAGSNFNSGVISNLSQIREKTAKNADALKQIGISVDVKGKLKIDEDTFKNADMSEVQKVFKNYGSSIATNASLVNFYMTTQANTSNGYTAAGTYNVQGGLRYTDAI